jgi:DNA-binding CsgD family transcriptional regulator
MTRRPIERRVLRLVAQGVDEAEIARRFKRSADAIGRLVVLAHLPREPRRASGTTAVLRPLERRVIAWVESGADHAEIGARFHRSAAHIHRVESLARHKLAHRSATEAGE